jgi:RHS repeat-associated protein
LACYYEDKFRQPGQYEDVETGLYYNRFRYYNPESGLYISQDPIRLAGNNPNFYAYVHDSNTMVDVFGLMAGGDRLFSSYFWNTVKDSIRPTKGSVKGAKLYEVIKKVDLPDVKKGDLFHLDTFHKTGVEIELYDSLDKHKGALSGETGEKIKSSVKGRKCE